MIKSVSQYTSPRSIAFCLQRQPISCLQCDCRRKFSIVERLQVAQFLLLWPSWWFLCYWDIFCSSAWHFLFPTGKAAAALSTNAEGSQTSANKGSTCWKKTLIYFVSVPTSVQHVIKPLMNCDLCIYFCVWSSVWFKWRKFMYANQEIYCCCCHHPLNSYTRGYKLFGWLKQGHQQCVHKNTNRYSPYSSMHFSRWMMT